MTIHPLMKVEPFTNRAQGHSPCAVLLNSETLDVVAMRTIADRINVPETVFVSNTDTVDFKIRCFNRMGEAQSRARSIVAAVYAIAEAGLLPLHAEKMGLSLEVSGRLTPIEIVFRDGTVQQVILPKTTTPEFLAIHHPGIVSLFGIALENVYPYAFVQAVAVGSPHLLIAVKYLDVVRNIQLDSAAYADLLQTTGFAGVHIFCLCGATQQGQTYARHFGTEAFAFEEPLSVSGTCSMAAYLWRYGMLGQSNFIAEHGPGLQQPEQAVVEIVGTRDQIEAIKVGGTAVVIAREQFHYS